MQKPLVRATVNGSSSGERESVIRIGRERVLHEGAPRSSPSRCNYGRNTMVCMEDERLPAIRGGGNLERYEISQAQRWYAAAMLTPTPRCGTIAVHPSIWQMDIGCLNLPRHCARRARSIISYSGVKNSRLTCSFLRYFR